MTTFLTKIDGSWISVATRNQCIMMFYELLKIPYKTALELERSVCAIQYTDKNVYIEHAKRICFNVKCNPSLLFSIERAFVTDERWRAELCSKRSRNKKINDHSGGEYVARKYENVNKSAEAVCSCKTCGSSDIAWQQKQTKGADESMTIFCTCSIASSMEMS